MARTTKSKEAIALAKARGKRLKSVRGMTDLTREELEQKYGISANTLQSWEKAKAGGLTLKGANKMVAIFREERIRCTVDWLMHGIGESPQLMTSFSSPVQENDASYTAATESEQSTINQELLAFRQFNPDSLDLIIQDNGMEPCYSTGDYVAGRRRKGPAIAGVVGLDCICETKANGILLRRLKSGTQPGAYTLVCLNPTTTVTAPTLYDQELLSAAPVIWHRRKEPKEA